MTYQETLDFLFKQLPMYQRVGKSAFKKDLKNTLALCSILNQPQKQFKSIHIAGTNGKGSTAHMLASVFQEAGYKTGLYTSPHLKDFRERVRVNGKMISEENVVQFVEQHAESFKQIQPSFFEWTVALAFNTFAKENVDIAIIETGLGGRLDSTNVILPELSIITNIGYDHMEMLGDTLELIAKEKAGIIKPKVPVVIANSSGQKELFDEIAHQLSAPITYAEQLEFNLELKTDLLGNYQAENVKGVYQSWLVLKKLDWKISFTHLEKGLEKVAHNTGFRARWEILNKNPLIVAETAHNEEGLLKALQQLQEQTYAQLHFVLGFVNDKSIDSLLALFPKTASYYFCQAKVPRAMSTEKILQIAKQFNLKSDTFSSVQEAFNAAKENANRKDLIYVGGSNFVVAEVL